MHVWGYGQKVWGVIQQAARAKAIPVKCIVVKVCVKDKAERHTRDCKMCVVQSCGRVGPCMQGRGSARTCLGLWGLRLLNSHAMLMCCCGVGESGDTTRWQMAGIL